ncbi:SixA phosphatase family protein [Nonlabens marinus]|uniref:Phosphoglycerate/bisphosphoglycerate mutase n=1 Tax=Nonlabens marinus S1-08 TaxID=1454201 RepID=W8W0P2_9FLAO|nr:histidine phosphatase family protein [Nonlabens marinus]BAO56671.1 phosphoglycerate/bisphosphoglycerate mutase [Nonlabens marinus S1-08]
MRKQLILVRHGKSSWEFDVRDHDRPLIQKGIDDAHAIGKSLREFPSRPDVIWSSTAARALQTATILTEYIDYDLKKLQLKRALYTFDSQDLLEIVKTIDENINCAMLVSHNHGLTDLANLLGSERFVNVPTTGTVMIEFESNTWKTITNGKTTFHLFPKNL